MKDLFYYNPKVGQRYTVMYGKLELTGTIVHANAGRILMNLDEDCAQRCAIGWHGRDYDDLGIQKYTRCWWVTSSKVVKQHNRSYKQIFRDELKNEI